MIAEASALVNTAPPQTGTRVRDRTLDLIRGVDIQIGDWVTIINPRPGQLNEVEIVGKTRNDFIKIEGTRKVGDR